MFPGTQDANPAAVECEDLHAGPPIVTATRGHPKHLLAVAALRAHPAACAIAFRNQSQHVWWLLPLTEIKSIFASDLKRKLGYRRGGLQAGNNLGRNECVISLR
jgi:hypothetical protein